MNSVARLLVSTLILSTAVPAAFAQKNIARGITQTSFERWPEALVLDSRDTPIKAVIVPGIGGRVMSYGFRGENLLWVNPDAASAGGSDAAASLGGFFCDLGPETASIPARPAITIGPYTWSAKKHQLLTLHSGEDKAAGASLEREAMFDPATGDLGLVHRLKNISDRDAAYSLWPRIACKPGGFALAPINKRSRFAAGWSVRKDSSGKPVYESTDPKVDGVRILDGVLVVRTGAGGARIGADSDQQWLAYALGRVLFVIHFAYYPGAVYAEGGNSVLVSWDATKTELQPMGAEARLRSRKSADLPMKWSLIELPAEVTTPEEARALVSKIPTSPFL